MQFVKNTKLFLLLLLVYLQRNCNPGGQRKCICGHKKFHYKGAEIRYFLNTTCFEQTGGKNTKYKWKKLNVKYNLHEIQYMFIILGGTSF